MKYMPEKMVAASRYSAYVHTLPEELRRQLIFRMNELIQEEREFCDRGNYKHMSQIITALALYDVLMDKGFSEEETARIVTEEMWNALDAAPMKRLAEKRFFFPLMQKLIPLGFKFGSGAGWRYTWHKEKRKDIFRFDCNECIYAKIFGKRGLLNIGKAFCHADIINYNELPYIEFQRTGTLCRGDRRCDFVFIRHTEEDGWDRSKSV